MPKFSTFSIYEKEMRHFIQNVAKQYTTENDGLTLEALRNWIYENGIEIFKRAQQELYYPYMTEYKEKYDHLPLISLGDSLGRHLYGLTAVKKAMLDQCNNNSSLKELIEHNFNNILLPAITAHERFIKIESEIASDLNAFKDKYEGNLSQVEALEKVIGLFEAKQSMYPELQEDFNNKLTLMGEVLAELRLQLKNASSNKFFQPKEANSLPTSKATASFAPSSPG